MEIKLRRKRKPTRRRFQFRLRTLLRVIVIVALAFGWPHLYRQYVFRRLQDDVGLDLMDLPELLANKRLL